MSIAALVTEGIGPGSTIPLFLTGGFGSGSPAPVVTPTGGAGYITRKRHRKAPADWEISREREEAFAREVREIYERVVEGKAPEAETRAAIARAVAPFTPEPAKRRLPTSPSIDFHALAANVNALDRLLAAFAQTRAAEQARRLAEEIEIERDDSETIEMLLRSLQ